MKIVNTEDMWEVDAGVTHGYDIPGIILMEHAAMAIMDYIRGYVAGDSRIIILCGPGSDGGDGFALAYLMMEEGYSHVRIHCNVPCDRMSHGEAVYARITENYDIEIIRTQDTGMIKPALDEAQIVVDTLSGTELPRNIEGFYDVLILYLNLLNKHVISIDITNGVNGDIGSIMNCAVQSDVTITFEYLKRGRLLYPGSSYYKDIIVKNITFLKVVKTNIEHNVHLLDGDTIRTFLPKRNAHSHERSFDRMMMVEGSSYVHGAITLAAKAALQSETGTSTLFLLDCISEIISMRLEKSVLLPAPSVNGSLSMISVDLLKRNLDAYDMVTIGNGMRQGEVTQAIVRAVLENDRPCLLDGDALYEAGKLVELLHHPAVTILTPHSKGMSYLCDCSVKEVLKNPLKCAMEFVKRYGNTVFVLKDQRTIICRKDDMCMDTASNHALAKGGGGDVLCGILTGLYTQGKEALQATAAAVYVHTCAADELIQRTDTYSIRPGDLIAVLSDTYGKLKR